jgi:hypothetical protein
MMPNDELKELAEWLANEDYGKAIVNCRWREDVEEAQEFRNQLIPVVERAMRLAIEETREHYEDYLRFDATPEQRDSRIAARIRARLEKEKHGNI